MGSPKTLYYAGVGSRATPEPALQVMREAAGEFARLGWVLRSGGASGADTAFEEGCIAAGGRKEIFLPSYRFNGNPSPFYTVTEKALKMAEGFHPAWNRCSPNGKLLHGRNCYQVLGWELDVNAHEEHSRFVLCWTRGGKGEGGTAQALRIAYAYDIPILDLGGEPQELQVMREAVDRFLDVLGL